MIAEELENQGRPGNLASAIIYAALGDHDRALQLLEQAFRARANELVFIGQSPECDGLRDDPRFADLLCRIGFPGDGKRDPQGVGSPGHDCHAGITKWENDRICVPQNGWLQAIAHASDAADGGLHGDSNRGYVRGCVVHHFRRLYTGTLILSVGINAIHGARLISEGAGDLIAFDRDYIANPDLAERIRLDAPLNEVRPEYFYGNSSAGYTDYPTLPQSQLIPERSNAK